MLVRVLIAFRADKGDYFLAGMIFDQLFDEDRATTTPSLLIGVIVGSMWSQVGATTARYLLFFL